ncbi:unnamed protein product [Acanthoscelides obtectus]|uniref:Uncharacterized protein n=1 Tax=Acanthoscelides obtectus TaxID=200917 RepID=A0A9P0KZM0_ACAOB|nr:unnamed protein product [Acanthoscelides obtectus]CAK1675366.1 hypothetical protein AOBTE_LOCUS30168 [Acanthoscelides obtectus]
MLNTGGKWTSHSNDRVFVLKIVSVVEPSVCFGFWTIWFDVLQKIGNYLILKKQIKNPRLCVSFAVLNTPFQTQLA